MTPVRVTYGEWHVCTSILLSLQYMSPLASDIYARVHYYVSSTCHPRQVTCVQEHTMKSLVYVTHGEWHICSTTLLCLQYMSPTRSDICARAHYHDFSIWHPRRVTYIQEHIVMSIVHVTHDEWHVLMSILLRLQYMSPTTSDMYARAYHHVSSTSQFVRNTYARAHPHCQDYICHPRRVTYTQKHTTMSIVCATHSEWHACKSTVPKTQVRQFPDQSSKGLAKPKVRP